MNKYHKIAGLYKRYREGPKKGKFIIGEYSKPEFKLLKDITWEFTEKLDGTCCRLIYYSHPLIPKGEKLEFKGKSDKSDIPPILLEHINNTYKEEDFTKEFGESEDKPDICIYGEGISHKVQRGGKYFKEGKGANFVAFDINIGGTWMDRNTVEMLCWNLRIPVAPRIGLGTIEDAINLVKKNPKSKYGNFTMEGLVIRPVNELGDRRRHRIITKIKTKDFKEE